jgi:hypothetical protein
MELMYQNTVYTVFDENTRRREGWRIGGGRRKCIHVDSHTSLSSCLHSEEKSYVTKCRPIHCWTGCVLTQGKITIYNGPTNALLCIKTLIQMSHIKTFKNTPTCFVHQMIIIRGLFDPG